MTDRPKLLLAAAFPDRDMAAFARHFTVLRLDEMADPAAFLAGPARDVTALATRGDIGADAALIGALPALKIIACYGVGYDAVDVEAARAAGVAVTNTPDVLTGDVADLAVGLTLDLCRMIAVGDAHVRAGKWGTEPLPLATRVHGRRVGIAGLGRIGAAIARRFSAFDCPVGYYNRSPREVAGWRAFPTLDDLAAWSEILVVAVAGGAGTRGIVTADTLAALGPEGFLVNISRGTTVDEAALIAALEERRIAGAALDVFLNEPDIDPRFLVLDNVLLQPHRASATVETRAAMGDLVLENLLAHFAGKPLPTRVV